MSKAESGPRPMRRALTKARGDGGDASLQELELFASRAAHDIKTPLRQIAVFCDMVAREDGERLSPTSVEWLDAARRSASRLNQLVDGLLAHARAGRRPENPTAVDLARVARETVDLHEDRLLQSGGAVEIGPLGSAYAPQWSMAALLQNLVSNAIAYHRPGVPPSVTISSEADGDDWLVLTIADNGSGVPEDARDAIFDPFERGVGAPHSSGVGLGLANCRRVVDSLGGAIWVEANAPHGSRFRARLPAARIAHAAAPATEASRRSRRPEAAAVD